MPLIIDDDNWDQFALEQTTQFGSAGTFVRDYVESPVGSLTFASQFPGPLIKRPDWSAMIKEREERGQTLQRIMLDAGVKVKDQGRTNYCWAFAPVSALELNRAAAGLPYVDLSPTSVAARVKNFRNVGGFGTQALQELATRGVNAASQWPTNAIDRKYDNQQSRVQANSFRQTEWWDLQPKNLDELITALLLGLPCPVVYMWWGHQVLAIDPVEVEPGSFGVRILNSWGTRWGDKGFAIIRGSRVLPDEAYAARAVTPTLVV